MFPFCSAVAMQAILGDMMSGGTMMTDDEVTPPRALSGEYGTFKTVKAI